MRANPHKPTPRSSQPASHAYPDRQYVSASSHNHGQATPNRQNPPAETASCESILTQSPIGDVATAIRSPEPSSCERILTRTRSSRIGPTDPDRQTVTVRVNPHTMTAARLRISQPHQPTRHRANKSSHNHGQATPNRQNPPAETASCESILTNRRSERSSGNQRMSPHTQHNRTHAHHAHRRSQPHHPHAPTYESRHIGRQTLAEHHQSSWPVSAGMHNPTHQPTNPVTKASNHRDPHDTTYATRRITYPVSANPAICERILTQSPTGSTASDKDSGAP